MTKIRLLLGLACFAFAHDIVAAEDIVLSNRYGRVSVSLMGGQVLSYVPTGEADVLFRPADMDFRPGRGMHGGIPVCWPWFGRYGEPGSRMHGLVRYCRWTCAEVTNGVDVSRAVLTLASSDETRKLWPHDFSLRYAIELGPGLALALEAENTGKEPFDVTAGFHPYFNVGDPARAVVSGLVEPVRVCPGIDGGRPTLSGGRYVLQEDNVSSAVEITAEGERKLIVWNPGPGWQPNDGADCNLAAGDWRRFVCVEPAVIGRESAIRLAPGGRHTLKMAVVRRKTVVGTEY